MKFEGIRGFLDIQVMVVLGRQVRFSFVLGFKKSGYLSTRYFKTNTLKYTAEDDLEVFSTYDLGLDWIYAHNFLTCLQRLSLYTYGHCEVSESAACLEKALFSCTYGHVEVS
ncbi:hypothetical protein Tco_0405605 [Tanacetum coccineum]